MAATMKDIAKRTGLGLATISSYFNGGNVREKNRVKIEEAIEELHYEVNEVARGLKTNATKTIGVVIPELNNTFCAEIITGMEDVLRSHGYATIVCDCRTDKKLERDAVEFLSRKRVDGIISMPVDAEGNHLKKFQKTGKPIVLIDRRIQELSCDSVLVDNEKAAEDAMRVFFKAGHRKIGIIGGPEEISTAQERLQGYRSAYEKENLPVRESLIYHGDYTIQGGVRGIEKLVADNPDMTAVFVTNYEMTMGAVIGMNELDLKIPEQLSMIGFDNLQFARACSPKLTIVAQPTSGIAREVAGHYAETAGRGRERRNGADHREAWRGNYYGEIRACAKGEGEFIMKPYLLGIDIGTSACKVAVFEKSGTVVAAANGDYPVYYPKEGWAEQNPEEWWSAVCQAVKKVIEKAGIQPEEIAGIGIDGQSWSAIAMDKDGNVLTNTPIWMDTRAQSICDRLNEEIGADQDF